MSLDYITLAVFKGSSFSFLDFGMLQINTIPSHYNITIVVNQSFSLITAMNWFPFTL